MVESAALLAKLTEHLQEMVHGPRIEPPAPRWVKGARERFADLCLKFGSMEREDKRAAVWRRSNHENWSVGPASGGIYRSERWGTSQGFSIREEAMAYADKCLAEEDAKKERG